MQDTDDAVVADIDKDLARLRASKKWTSSSKLLRRLDRQAREDATGASPAQPDRTDTTSAALHVAGSSLTAPAIPSPPSPTVIRQIPRHKPSLSSLVSSIKSLAVSAKNGMIESSASLTDRLRRRGGKDLAHEQEEEEEVLDELQEPAVKLSEQDCELLHAVAPEFEAIFNEAEADDFQAGDNDSDDSNDDDTCDQESYPPTSSSSIRRKGKQKAKSKSKEKSKSKGRPGVLGDASKRDFRMVPIRTVRTHPTIDYKAVQLIYKPSEVRPIILDACQTQLEEPRRSRIVYSLEELHKIAPRIPSPSEVTAGTLRRKSEAQSLCALAKKNKRSGIFIAFNNRAGTASARHSNNWLPLESLCEHTSHNQAELLKRLDSEKQLVVEAPCVYGEGEALTDRINKRRGLVPSSTLEFLDRELIVELATAGTGKDLIKRLGKGWEEPIFTHLVQSFEASLAAGPSIEYANSSTLCSRLRQLPAYSNGNIHFELFILNLPLLSSHPEQLIKLEVIEYYLPAQKASEPRAQNVLSSFIILDVSPCFHNQFAMRLYARVQSDAANISFHALAPLGSVPELDEAAAHATMTLQPFFGTPESGMSSFFSHVMAMAAREIAEKRALGDESVVIQRLLARTAASYSHITSDDVELDTPLQRMVLAWKNKALNTKKQLQAVQKAHQAIKVFLDEDPKATILDLRDQDRALWELLSSYFLTGRPQHCRKLEVYNGYSDLQILYMIAIRPSEHTQLNELLKKHRQAFETSDARDLSKEALQCLDRYLMYHDSRISWWPRSVYAKLDLYRGLEETLSKRVENKAAYRQTEAGKAAAAKSIAKNYTGQRMLCEVCNVTFPRWGGQKRHTAEYHATGPKPVYLNVGKFFYTSNRRKGPYTRLADGKAEQRIVAEYRKYGEEMGREALSVDEEKALPPWKGEELPSSDQLEASDVEEDGEETET